MLAPIILFVYNRLEHVKSTITALKRNYLACDSILYIFSDNYKNDKDKKHVKAVREYLRSIDGFNEVRIIERKKNFGLFESITSGVTEVIKEHGKVIVLEDDLITSKYFLKFMNEALDFYENEEKVDSVSGYSLNIDIKDLQETFFLRFGESYSWATWQRSWKNFEYDADKLLNKIRNNNLEYKFNFEDGYNFMALLEEQSKRKNYSWAILWCAKIFADNKLTLFPSKSLVKSVGHDGSGTNCPELSDNDDLFITDLSSDPVKIGNINVEETILAYNLYAEHYKKFKKLTYAK